MFGRNRQEETFDFNPDILESEFASSSNSLSIKLETKGEAKTEGVDPDFY